MKMLFKNLMIQFVLISAACTTSNRVNVPTAPTTARNEKTRTQPENNTTDNGSGRVEITDNRQSSIPVKLEERVFRRYAIDTSKMKYMFTYLEVSMNGDISFANGNATIQLTNLPSGRSGNLTLELLEGTASKFKGSLADQVMQPGVNQLSMSLKPVDASANIDVNIGNGSGSGTGGSTGGGTGGSSTDPNALTYSRDIKSILDNNCSECHHTGGRSPDFSSFPFGGNSADQNAVVSKLINVSSGSGASMPPSPRSKLSTTDLDKITLWKSQGLNP